MLNKRYFKTKGEYDVTFAYPAEAESVALVIETNDWEPIEMKKTKGVFKTKLRLPADGRFQYRFLVNGEEWVNDDAADDFVANQHGTTNSVVDTAVN